MARALTDHESEVFNAIRDASNIALVQTTFNGQETAVIAAINEDGGMFNVTPLAVLLIDDMFTMLADPTDNLLTREHAGDLFRMFSSP